MLTDLSTDEKIWIDPALLAIDRAAVEPVMRVCRDPRPLARRAAVTALGRMVPRAPRKARGDKMVPTIEPRVFIDYLREVCRRDVADLAENDSVHPYARPRRAP